MGCKRDRVRMYAALVVAVGSYALVSTARGTDAEDFATKLSKAMPPGWSATFLKPEGDRLGAIVIETAKIQTGDTSHADDVDETRIETVEIRVEVHPLYASAKRDEMLNRNKAVYERLKKTGGPKRARASNELIHVPQFRDNKYSYWVKRNRRRPRLPEDMEKFRQVLKRISAEWKLYGSEDADVAGALLLILNG